MRGAVDELQYRETYSGIPLRIRLFIIATSTVAFLMVEAPLLVIIQLTDGWPRYVAALTYYGLLLIHIVPRLDIFVPLGFRMFRWLITVK